MIDRVLVFSGTTEGRRLAEVLSDSGINAVVCVATEYGSEVMDELPGVLVRQGRLDESAMAALMAEGFWAVVDATHPFATEVSENIKEAAKKAGLSYLRLSRSTDAYHGPDGDGRVRFFDTNEECALALKNTQGNILLTTGSKELSVYCKDESVRDRLFVRVLPSEESIALCRGQGIKSSRVIAMQGPFSEEMNSAILHQCDIGIMVTKETGAVGGSPQKAAAAAKNGVSLYVINNPEKSDGMSFGEVCRALGEVTGKTVRGKLKINIALVGAGMGDVGVMTSLARERIKDADLIFGAKRLIECASKSGDIKPSAKSYPLYMADDIIGVLDDMVSRQNEACEKTDACNAVVLFSGDTGFYSGAGSVYEKLNAWKERYQGATVEIIPGISSVSYFAAKLGISWDDARLVSVHGRGKRKDWQGEVLSAVRCNKKTFILVSGKSDVHDIGDILRVYGLGDCKVFAGCRLSMPGENISSLTPATCAGYEGEGPVILVVINDETVPAFLTPHRADGEFIRGEVPMTKEEVRDVAVCKLGLTDGAVVYDIGSGTGSVAVSMAECGSSVRVFAIERNEEGCELIRKNCEKFTLANVEIIKGAAPEALLSLPAPTHAFIGGSGGELSDILKVLYEKNPRMRIVITSVTLETTAMISDLSKSVPVRNEEIIEVQVSRTKKAGSHTLLRAENPVFICSFDFGGDDVRENDV